MAKGGRRKGAGVKKGSTQKIPRLKVAKEYGPKLLEELGNMLYGSNLKDKKWAIHELLPYAIQKQPQALEHSGPGGDEICIKITTT